MGRLGSVAFGAGAEGCKKRISDESTQNTSERRYRSSTACGEEKHTGTGHEEAIFSRLEINLRVTYF
jgi:hypothetical protein